MSPIPAVCEGFYPYLSPVPQEEREGIKKLLSQMETRQEGIQKIAQFSGVILTPLKPPCAICIGTVNKC